MNEQMKNIIIMDWDDTLFPTTWFLQKKYEGNNIYFDNFFRLKNEMKMVLKKIDLYVLKILQGYSSCGTVVIVTNAGDEWYNESKKYLPLSNNILKDIPVYFSKKLYGIQFFNNVEEWKKRTFLDLVNKEDSNNLCVISIGDAEYEYIAVTNLLNVQKVKRIKSLRLLTAPTPTVLMDELHLLFIVGPHVCASSSNIDWKYKYNNKNYPFFT